MRAALLVLHQTGLEQRAFWRNPDSAFFTFVLPPGLLLLLGTINRGDAIPGRDVDAVIFFVPGIVAFGIIVASFANLAVKITVLRNDGVLKRIRTTPLSPTLYLTGHLVSTLTTTLLVSGATVAIGSLVFDASPRAGRIPALFLGVCLGIVCFAALGLAISVAIRNADAAGPITNAAYLPLALVSGVFDPTMEMPNWLSRAVEVLPIRPLTDVLQAAYDPAAEGLPITDLLVLAMWSIIGIVIARRYFRWQP